MTKKEAKEIIELNKNNTYYFDGVIKAQDMMRTLQWRMGFGTAESNVIMAALVLSGAKFK